MSPERSRDLFGDDSPAALPVQPLEARTSKPIMRSMPDTTAECALEQVLKGLAELVYKKYEKEIKEFDVGLNEMVGDGPVLGLETLEAIEGAGQVKVNAQEKGLDDSDLTIT